MLSGGPATSRVAGKLASIIAGIVIERAPGVALQMQIAVPVVSASTLNATAKKESPEDDRHSIFRGRDRSITLAWSRLVQSNSGVMRNDAVNVSVVSPVTV